MEKSLKRRDFLIGGAVAAGGLILVGNTVVAAESAPKGGGFNGLANVDGTLFSGINRVVGGGEKTLTDKKHAPVIEVPARIVAGEGFAITVMVGEVEHPMGPSHFIQNIALLVGNEPAGHLELRPEVALAKATFWVHIDKPVTLVARAYCNLHGLWESRLEVAPTGGA